MGLAVMPLIEVLIQEKQSVVSRGPARGFGEDSFIAYVLILRAAWDTQNTGLRNVAESKIPGRLFF